MQIDGLGICDIRLDNLALLDKWRWKLVFNVTALWRDIFLVR